LALQLEKEGKKKVPLFGYQIFRFREKNIPSENFDLPEGEIVLDFAWEPKGSKIGIIHGEALRPNVSFYSIEGSQTKHLTTLDKKSVSKLYWSPLGNYILLAGLHNVTGSLEFYDVKNLETLAQEEHYMCTSIEWDPTGRYVTSVVSWWKHQLETGYNIYSFSGKLLKKFLKDKFFEFLWRPRPPTLLPPEKLKEIEKNIKSYGQKFKKEDDAKLEEERRILEQKRKELRNDFLKVFDSIQKEYKNQKEERHGIPGYISDEEAEYIEQEEIIETLISQEETIIG